MKTTMNRRTFLRTGVAGGAGVVLARSGLAWPPSSSLSSGRQAAATPSAAGLCLTICNHWSYIGIGWQLGLESCVLSVTDAIEMADRPPHVKTCLNLDARAYEFMAEKFPEVTERLKKYLADGKVELIGGTYGQPMGTSISGESNVRQIVMGRQVIQTTFGYAMATFLEEEEFTHPQIPQLASLAGFQYASLAQLDTWGRAGCPRQDVNALWWKGIDGTAIACVPKNALFGYSPDLKKLAASDDFRKLAGLGKPLIFAWEEFGWESPEKPAYLTSPDKYRALEQVEFVTLREYLDKYGSQMKETVYVPMDGWNKSLTWGLGGDQVRILDRKIDGLLLAAELFDGIAAALGYSSQADNLEKAWRDLLASQSHDVGLCEYSRWQGDRMAPFDRIEDKHNFTWGAIGYNHLDAAQKQGEAVLGAALGHLAGRADTQTDRGENRAAVVFNPHAWPRTGLAPTGRIYPMPPGSRGVIVKDRTGQPVPSQIVKSTTDGDGRLVVAEVDFLARDVPAAGYDTYFLEFTSEPASAPSFGNGLIVDEPNLTMENEFLRVSLDPTTGGVASLRAKTSGEEMLDSAAGGFPRFNGRPNPTLPTKPEPPAGYDSRQSKAQIDWIERGPLRSTLRARHDWRYLKFETRVTLAAGSPYVEVTSRVLAFVPPQPDVSPPDIKEGYWFSLAPGFPVTSVLRDFPFGVEETKNPAFHGLTFVDLLGRDTGLLLLHAGTQYFRRDAPGQFSNLVMREWESYFTKEYGWPVYAEYRHGLMPHGGKLSNSDRLRAAAAFTRPLACVLREPRRGDLRSATSFLSVSPPGVELTAFRKKPAGGYEMRVVETEGRRADATVAIRLPLSRAILTDLLGNRAADAALRDGRLTAVADPWKVLTFHLE
jgi:alpha-mannosidase